MSFKMGSGNRPAAEMNVTPLKKIRNRQLAIGDWLKQRQLQQPNTRSFDSGISTPRTNRVLGGPGFQR
jgi:hypothetical protein